MELENSAIEEFQELYFNEYGVRLTKEEAIEFSIRLVRFVKTVYGRDLLGRDENKK